MSWVKDNITQPEIVEYLFNIRVNLPDRMGVFQHDIGPDIEINYDMLEEQLRDTPQIFCFFSMLVAEQTEKVKLLERKSKTIRGKIISKALTEAQALKTELRRLDLQDITNADPVVIQIDAEVIHENRILEKLQATVETLIKKMDSLRSLSGFKREEKRLS